MVSFWTRIVTFLNYLTVSPISEEWSNQHPLGVITKPSSLPHAVAAPDPFVPPSAPGDFKCEYPKLKDYAFCSTYGDRSCWLKSSDPTKLTYDINTNYEKEFPEGIVRKVST